MCCVTGFSPWIFKGASHEWHFRLRMKNRPLSSSSGHIALGAGMNTDEGKVPGTSLRHLAVVWTHGITYRRHEEDTTLN
jgi:hypothetical protein